MFDGWVNGWFDGWVNDWFFGGGSNFDGFEVFGGV